MHTGGPFYCQKHTQVMKGEVPTGWRCPECKTIWSPEVKSCPNSHGESGTWNAATEQGTGRAHLCEVVLGPGVILVDEENEQRRAEAFLAPFAEQIRDSKAG